MIRWRIYYADGTAFDDAMGGPGDAPCDGVLGIRQRTDCDHHPSEWMKAEHNWQWNGEGHCNAPLLEGADWYFWRADVGRWMRTDLMGLLDQFKRKGAQYLKQGEYVTHGEWERALQRMGHDADLP